MGIASEEELIQTLTREVLRRLSLKSDAVPIPAPEEPRRKRALVLGDPCGLCLEGGWIIETEEQYKASPDVERYDAVYITKLTNAHLCAVALGWDGGAFACAVTNALLRGIPVRMRHDAPVWRRFADRTPAALAKTLRGYEETLAAYGVEILGPGAEADVSTTVSACAAKPGPAKRRVVTAELAKQLSANADEVCLNRDDIVTPSAKDVFTAARVRIVRP